MIVSLRERDWVTIAGDHIFGLTDFSTLFHIMIILMTKLLFCR